MASPTLDRLSQPQERTGEQLLQAAMGYMASAAVYTAAKLNIADLLAQGPRPVAELAAETDCNEDALYRILRALVSMGVFTEPAPRQFGLSPSAELLRSDVPGSLRDVVLWIDNRFHFQVWAEMPYSVRTGEPAVEMLFGKPCFDAMAEIPEVFREFNDGMTSFSRTMGPALLEAYDFSGTRVLMDVAGGHGEVLSEVLTRYPDIEGVLFDLPHVVEGAKHRLARLNLDGRCRTVSGNFFESIPAGADTYYMQHIIHDWEDEKALVILRNCREALKGVPDGKLLVMDTVLPQGSDPHFGKLLDLEMLLLPGGKERTEPELRRLFAEAGFEITRIVPTKAPQSVVEARPARS